MTRSDKSYRAGPHAVERYRALFENMSEGFVLCEAVRSADGRLTDYWVRTANPAFLARAPIGEAMINRRQLEVRPETPRPWLDACERALAGGAVRFEFRDPMNLRWYEVHMTRLSATEFGQFFVDVTSRKMAEQRMIELFNELNHRVKNNLAIASSILELQARTVPREVGDHLRKAVDRLHTIAEIHTALYRQNSTERADLAPYLQNLCERLSHTLFEDRRVRIHVDCPSVEAPVEQAVNIGLIVNELVTNAAKHAFPAGREGVIHVALSLEDDGLHLSVIDDGRGLPSLPEAVREGGLGLRLARSLAEGLGGKLQADPAASSGATFRLRIPRPAPHQTEVQPRLL
jgi:two-component sensor histidine kinase